MIEYSYSKYYFTSIKVLLKTEEYENAIANLYYKYYKESDNGNKRGGKAKVAKILGLNQVEVTHALKAYEMKEKYDLKLINISTQSAYLLSTLPERDQTRIVAQLQSGVISKDLQGYIPKLKGLSEEVKNAVLKVEDPIPIELINGGIYFLDRMALACFPFLSICTWEIWFVSFDSLSSFLFIHMYMGDINLLAKTNRFPSMIV